MLPFRNTLRSCFFRIWKRAFATDDGKHAAADSLKNLLAWRPPNLPRELLDETPYADVGSSSGELPVCERNDMIFVTARFRSGSTLLWNVFRHLPGFTAYYEPFNERRWFDARSRGGHVDGSHRKVNDYWAEYDGLEDLAPLFNDEWNERSFFMGEDAWDPQMQAYCEELIGRAEERPVLQFNRLDFRLPWARRVFPNAKFVHLYRHPRDQWMSILQKPERFPPDGRVEDFWSVDGFYLRRWARDLKYHCPFLDERFIRHPYQLHYYLWKLSYVYGRNYCDLSLGFETLARDPEASLFRLFDVCDIDVRHLESALPLISPPRFGKWKEYADDTWFRAHEEVCERTLRQFFGDCGGNGVCSGFTAQAEFAG